MIDYDDIPLDANISIGEYAEWPLEALQERKKRLFEFAMRCDCTPPFVYIPERRPCGHYSPLIEARRSKIYQEIGIRLMPSSDSDWINRPPYYSLYYAGTDKVD